MGNILSYFGTQTTENIEEVIPSSPTKKQKIEDCSSSQEDNTSPIIGDGKSSTETTPDDKGMTYGSIDSVDGYIGLSNEDPERFYPVGSEYNGYILGPTGNEGVTNKCTGGGPYCNKDEEEEGKMCTFCGPTGNEGVTNLSKAQAVYPPTGTHFAICHTIDVEQNKDNDKSKLHLYQKENNTSTETNVVETLPDVSTSSNSLPRTKLSIMAEEFVPSGVIQDKI